MVLVKQPITKYISHKNLELKKDSTSLEQKYKEIKNCHLNGKLLACLHHLWAAATP